MGMSGWLFRSGPEAGKLPVLRFRRHSWIQENADHLHRAGRHDLRLSLTRERRFPELLASAASAKRGINQTSKKIINIYIKTNKKTNKRPRRYLIYATRPKLAKAQRCCCVGARGLMTVADDVCCY